MSMKQLTRAELETYATIYLTPVFHELKRRGVVLAVALAPVVAPEDGKAIVCTNVTGGLLAACRLFEECTAQIRAGNHFAFDPNEKRH